MIQWFDISSDVFNPSAGKTIGGFNKSPRERICAFVDFVHKHVRGDEKGESQICWDRLFWAFGHDGIMEAGGFLEFRIHRRKGTRLFLW